ncbi:MAG TPA: NUDIX domain-containing protein, partial [Gemmatimonadaceae bacterium]|nr:NUDIX domain-containing protein [Gemmatimonadaceae bacterium]
MADYRREDGNHLSSLRPGRAVSWRPVVVLPVPSARVSVESAIPVRVVAAVVRRGGRLLVCQRPAHKRHGGLWEFPGGKLEEGESILDGARRELAEELDVVVRDVDEQEFSFVDPGSPFVIEFHPVEIDGNPRCLEHTALAWVTPEQLLTLPLAPSDRQFALYL